MLTRVQSACRRQSGFAEFRPPRAGHGEPGRRESRDTPALAGAIVRGVGSCGHGAVTNTL
jgi:hypothetical protein